MLTSTSTRSARPTRSAPSSGADLPHHPLFFGLTEEQRERLIGLGSRRSYDHGEVILREGTRAHHLFILHSGRARVVKSGTAVDGGDRRSGQLAITVLEQGEAFGEVHLLDEEPAAETVMAEGPVCVWCLDVREVRDAGPLRDELLANLAPVLAAKLRQNGQIAAAALLAEQEQSQERRSASLLVVALVVLCCGYLIVTAAAREVSPARRPDQAVVSAICILIGAVCMAEVVRRGPYPLSAYGLSAVRPWRAARVAFLYTLPVLALLTAGKEVWLLSTGRAQLGEPLFRFDLLFPDGQFLLGPYVLAVGTYALLAPLQEFIVRAGLQSMLRVLMPQSDGATNWAAILLANMVFASLHSDIGFRFVAGVFLPGLFFGWLFEKQRSLVGVALAHAILGDYALYVLGIHGIIGGH